MQLNTKYFLKCFVFETQKVFNKHKVLKHLSMSWWNTILLENANILQTNAKFLARIQKFWEQTQCFTVERKCFVPECNVSCRNANVLLANAKFLSGMQKFYKLMQSFSGNFCERTQSFSVEHKRFISECKVSWANATSILQASISQESQYLLVECNFVRKHKHFANKRRDSQWNTKSLVSEYKLSEGAQMFYKWAQSFLGNTKFRKQMQSLSRSAKVFRANTKILRERKSFANKYKVCWGEQRFCERT